MSGKWLRSRPSSGLSTLEVILAMVISAPLVFAAGKSIVLSQSDLREARRLRADGAALAKTASFLQMTVAALDSQPLPLFPVIHKNGRILFSDGSKSPLMRSAASGSDAISFVRTSIDTAFILTPMRHTAALAAFRACRIFNSDPIKDGGTLLVVTPHGIFEALRVGRGLVSRRCGVVRLKLVDSIVAPPPPAELKDSALQSAGFMLPIADSFTLFVDQSSTLRFAKHRGRRVIENQPAAEGVYRLKLAAADTGSLSAAVWFADRGPARIFIPSRMPRIGLSEFIFNLQPL